MSLEADSVITAIGQTPELSFLGGSRVKTGRLIQVDAVTYATNAEGIFAASDAVTGPASVIEALAAGRKAAVSIDRYLKGESLSANPSGEEKWDKPLVVDTTGAKKKDRLAVPTLPVASRSGNFKEVSLGFKKEEAMLEASRCLACSCQTCVKALGCPATIVTDGEVTIDEAQCPGCGVCAHVCPKEAIVQNKA